MYAIKDNYAKHIVAQLYVLKVGNQTKHRQTDKQTGRETNRDLHRDRQTDRQTDRQKDGQTDRQTDRGQACYAKDNCPFEISHRGGDSGQRTTDGSLGRTLH